MTKMKISVEPFELDLDALYCYDDETLETVLKREVAGVVRSRIAELIRTETRKSLAAWAEKHYKGETTIETAPDGTQYVNIPLDLDLIMGRP